jgi:hypothetical protein
VAKKTDFAIGFALASEYSITIESTSNLVWLDSAGGHQEPGLFVRCPRRVRERDADDCANQQRYRERAALPTKHWNTPCTDRSL